MIVKTKTKLCCKSFLFEDKHLFSHHPSNTSTMSYNTLGKPASSKDPGLDNYLTSKKAIWMRGGHFNGQSPIQHMNFIGVLRCLETLDLLPKMMRII